MDVVDGFYADKDLFLLKKLTLVIPTYNRNYYLSRCLWYHAHFPFGEIIVADSSPEEKKIVNRETVAKVREIFGANIRYLEYEPETEKYGGDIYRKWGDAMQHVETEYSQICTDKEFIIPTTINKCIEFLEKNTDYVIASGRYYHINCSKEIYNYTHIYIHRKGSGVQNRIKEYFNKVYTFDETQLLSLYRSNCQKSIYNILFESNIQDIRFGESYLAYIGYMYGKIKYFPEFTFNVRDVTHLKDKSKINKAESSALRYPSYIEYNETSLEYASFYSAYKKAIKNTLSICTSDNNTSLKQYEKLIIQTHKGAPYKSHKLLNVLDVIKKNIKITSNISEYMQITLKIKQYIPKDIILLIMIIEKYWKYNKSDEQIPFKE